MEITGKRNTGFAAFAVVAITCVVAGLMFAVPARAAITTDGAIAREIRIDSRAAHSELGEIVTPPEPFSTLVASWRDDGCVADVEVQTSKDGKTWSAWFAATPRQEQESANGRVVSRFIELDEPMNFVRYRVRHIFK